MIKHIYTCDRCKEEQKGQEEQNQLWYILLKVSAVSLNAVPKYDAYTPVNTPMWCRKCVDEMQMLGFPKALPDTKPIKEVTLEEKLIEVLFDAISDEVYNQIQSR